MQIESDSNKITYGLSVAAVILMLVIGIAYLGEAIGIWMVLKWGV